ncbi:MAG: glucodextranase DOMON-like domain-containing protein [Sulfolobales archaeon]|nr:hypothetical protein [Sulfolobales archaeon]MDW8082191.1 glucodextranase DOMON-like domain-containing protein [Sulfolobales archaeon]
MAVYVNSLPKAIAVLLLFTIAAANIAGLLEFVSGASSPSKISYIDPEGDQYGPGGYKYRAVSDTYRAEYFDLRSFSIEVVGGVVKISLGFTKVANPLNSPLGFSPQIAHIYIVGNCSSSKTETLGLNVRLRAVDAWCACVIVAPNLGGYLSKLVLAGGESIALDRLYVVNNTIVAEVPAVVIFESVGYNVATWRYLVAISAYDESSPDRLIRVGVEGEDTPIVYTGVSREDIRFLPRVLDILVETIEDQRYILSTFSARHGDIATVSAYPYAENTLLPLAPAVETSTVVTTSIVTETYAKIYYLPGATATVTNYVQVPKYGLELYILALTSVILLVVLAVVLSKKGFGGK